MSLTGQRGTIARYLSTVDGVTGHEFRPEIPNDGDAWPVLGPGDRDAGTAFMVTWGVRVFVPQDEQAASMWWDAHWPALFYALETYVGTVDRFVPVLIQTQAGDQLAFEITIRTGE